MVQLWMHAERLVSAHMSFSLFLVM